jgi:hypothetical protein
MIAIADDRAAATSRLGELMQPAKARRKSTGARWVAAMLLCLALGACLAWLLRPRPMLGDARDQLPSLGSPWAQLYHAKLVNTEAAWMAVEEYFPNLDAYYHNLAKQGLVYYYFRTQDFDKAIRPLHELANLSASDPLHAFGLAGLVVADTKLGNVEQARDERSKLTSEMLNVVRDKMPQMDTLLQPALAELERTGS